MSLLLWATNVLKRTSIPDATAPQLQLTEIDTVAPGESTNLSAMASGGNYDEIEYTWTVVSGGGRISA